MCTKERSGAQSTPVTGLRETVRSHAGRMADQLAGRRDAGGDGHSASDTIAGGAACPAKDAQEGSGRSSPWQKSSRS
jgi:hypothetical protein